MATSLDCLDLRLVDGDIGFNAGCACSTGVVNKKAGKRLRSLADNPGLDHYCSHDP